MIECSAVHERKSLRAGEVSLPVPRDSQNMVCACPAAPASAIVSGVSSGQQVDSGEVCWPASFAYVFVKNACASPISVTVKVGSHVSEMVVGFPAFPCCVPHRFGWLRLARRRHCQGGLPDTENDSSLVENACAPPISATVKVCLLQQPYGCFSRVFDMASCVSTISNTATKVSIDGMQPRRQTCSR